MNSSSLLVFGYLRRNKKASSRRKQLPGAICELIAAFFGRSYYVLGIGYIKHGQFGLADTENETKELCKKLLRLEEMEQLLCSPHDISRGWERYTIRDIFGTFHCAGQNSYGQICERDPAKSFKSVCRFKELRIPSNCGRIALVSDGLTSEHQLFVNDANQLFGCGRNRDGQFGKRSLTDNICVSDEIPRVSIPMHHRIIQIQTGSEHTLILTEYGNVYGCGANDSGQIGITTIADQRVEKLIQIPKLSNIVHMVVGRKHNLLLTQSNELICFGSNCYKQFGLKTNEFPSLDDKVSEPAVHPFFSAAQFRGNSNGNDDERTQIVSIVVGWNHTGIIDSAHALYLFGQNDYGQMAMKTSAMDCVDYIESTDKRVPEFASKAVLDVGCGDSHTLILISSEVNANGVPASTQVYACGMNDYLQCSNADDAYKLEYPTLWKKSDLGIPDNKRILKVIANRSNSIIICDL